MAIDGWALLGTGIIGALAYGVWRLYRAAQKVPQGCYDQGYIAGRAAGQKESSRLAYTQGHEEGLVIGLARGRGESGLSYEKGYERGQADLLEALQPAEQIDRPAMSA